MVARAKTSKSVNNNDVMTMLIEQNRRKAARNIAAPKDWSNSCELETHPEAKCNKTISLKS